MPKDVNQKKLDEEMARRTLDIELDLELEATFPASDALSALASCGKLRILPRRPRPVQRCVDSRPGTLKGFLRTPSNCIVDWSESWELRARPRRA